MNKEIACRAKPSAIYPGAYEPGGRIAQGPTVADQEKEKNTAVPAVNVSETTRCYKIKIAAPGFSKEDFDVEANAGILYIKAFSQNQEQAECGPEDPGVIQSTCFRKEIPLPGNIDTAFTVGQYKNGMLVICLYKASHPSGNYRNRVVIY